MSSAREQIIASGVSFYIPVISSFRYCKIKGKSHALSSVLSLGYIETSSLEVSIFLRMYFHKVRNYGFKLAGKIDSVRLKSGIIVYRQRLEYTSFVDLLKILRHFHIWLKIPDSFKVENRHLKYFRSSLNKLRSASKGHDLKEWMTDSILLQLAFMCDLYGIKLQLYKELTDMVHKEVLVKAPYICGKAIPKESFSTILIVPLYYFSDNRLLFLLGERPKCYVVENRGKYLHIFGYVTKGIHFRRRGIMQHGYIDTGKSR